MVTETKQEHRAESHVQPRTGSIGKFFTAVVMATVVVAAVIAGAVLASRIADRDDQIAQPSANLVQQQRLIDLSPSWDPDYALSEKRLAAMFSGQRLSEMSPSWDPNYDLLSDRPGTGYAEPFSGPR